MSRQLSILLVDDEILALRPLTRILHHEGFEADCATNGEAALAKLRARRFDFVLLDLLMPGVSGLDVLEALHDAPDRPFVIVCSGSGDDILESARRLGADAILPKPMNLEHLLTILRSSRPVRPLPQFPVLRRLAPAIDGVA